MEPPGSTAHQALSSLLYLESIPETLKSVSRISLPPPMAPKAGPPLGSSPNWYNPVPGSLLPS